MFNRIFRVGSFFFERRTIHKKIIYELTIDNMLMSLGRDRISLKWWYLIHFRFQIDPNSDTTRTLTAAQLRCELSEIDLVSEWRHIQRSRNDVDEQRRSALLCELTIELHVMKPTHARDSFEASTVRSTAMMAMVWTVNFLLCTRFHFAEAKSALNPIIKMY